MRFLVRADDLFVGADFSKWDSFISICRRLNVRPIIGLIPFCEDESLLRFSKSKIVDLVHIKEWEKDVDYLIHGTYHRYHPITSDLLNRSSKSEFAGLPYSKQRRLIRKSIKWFEDNRIEYKGFMAPSHSFDKITLKVLADEGIKMISDGYGFYGYNKYGLLFIPQLFSTGRNFGFGYYTLCFHPLTTSIISIRNNLYLASDKGNLIALEDFKISNLLHCLTVIITIPLRIIRYVNKN